MVEVEILLRELPAHAEDVAAFMCYTDCMQAILKRVTGGTPRRDLSLVPLYKPSVYLVKSLGILNSGVRGDPGQSLNHLSHISPTHTQIYLVKSLGILNSGVRGDPGQSLNHLSHISLTHTQTAGFEV